MKKILGLTIAALLVMALVGGGTWAYFSDTETSTNNLFTAGTLDLQTNGANGVTATLGDGANPIGPGFTDSGTITLKNNGTMAANHVEIKFASVPTNNPDAVAVAADTGDADIADMSETIEVTALTYDVTDYLALTGVTFDEAVIEAADANDDQKITFDELDGVSLDDITNVPTPSGAATKDFDIAVLIPTTVTNGIQGDVVTLTITFGLMQDASQDLP